MKNLDTYFSEYKNSHQHPVNIFIHLIFVPLIFFTIFGMIWSLQLKLPFFTYFKIGGDGVNIIYFLVLCVGIFYGCLHKGYTFFFLILTSLFLLFLDQFYKLRSFEVGVGCFVIFFISWVAQFIGHHIEGRKPSFLQDLTFLLIGPLWVFSFYIKFLGKVLTKSRPNC